MSIQVLNGYKIKKISSLKKLNKSLESIRKEINEVYYQEYHKEVAKLISSILDMKAIGYDKDVIRERLLKTYQIKIKNDISLDELILFLTKKEFSNNQGIKNHFNFSCKLSLYILDDSALLRIVTSKPTLLVNIGFEDSDWIRHPGNLLDVVPWDYDSRENQPNPIKLKEWKERASDWEYALNNLKPLKMRVNDVIVDYDKKIVLGIVNEAFKKRCEVIAEDRIHSAEDMYKDMPKYRVQEEIRKAYTEMYVALKQSYTEEDLKNIII